MACRSLRSWPGMIGIHRRHRVHLCRSATLWTATSGLSMGGSACADAATSDGPARRPSLDGFKRAGVPHRSPIFDGRHACLADLPPLVEAQLLLGIQRVIKLGLRVGADSLERVARRVRDERVEDVAVLSDASVLAPRDSEMFTTLRVILEAATDAMTDVESEFQRDVWHLRVLYPATRYQTRVISFVEISQRWLRELTKVWCQRRSASIAESTLYQSACCTRGLSRFLGTLPHRGERPELLTRDDLERFLQWQCASSTPEYSRTNVRHLRELLRFARRYGHTAAGGIAAGLAEEFSLLDEDVRFLNRRAGENGDYEPGKAIPEYVLHQLLEPATLELLTNEDARVIFQLLAHTGRRPVEICALDADCLEWAEQAATGPRRPLLRYKREKPPKKRITLPITAEAAELIERQQAAVLERYPGRALRDLKLFPSAKKNTDGRRPVMTYSFGVMLRRWVDGLSLVTADGEPFPSAAVTPPLTAGPSPTPLHRRSPAPSAATFARQPPRIPRLALSRVRIAPLEESGSRGPRIHPNGATGRRDRSQSCARVPNGN